MSELNYYACGGTGINVMKDLLNLTNTRTNKEAKIIALDSSDANPTEGMFDILNIPVAKGSGKLQGKHSERARPFVESAIAKYKPGSFNVVLCSTSGGTGSMMGAMVARRLLLDDHPTVMVLISDHSSFVEKNNATNTKRNLAKQLAKSQIGKPIVYLEIVNGANHTRGEINEKIVQELDLLSIFLTESNEEIDREDIVNFLNYTKFANIPASMSQITFHYDSGAREYNGKPPVCAMSLFGHRNDVVSLFPGTVYRATGVYNKANNPPLDKTKDLHMTLNHGEALDELKKDIESIKDDQANISGSYARFDDFKDSDLDSEDGMNW